MSLEGVGGAGAQREQVVELLCEHFANDALTVEEFERRVDAANAADTLEELRAVIADLPGQGATLLSDPQDLQRPPVPARKRPPSMPATVTGGGPVVVSPDLIRDRNWIVAVWSGPTRKGQWMPARKTLVTAVQGGAELDFREARLGPGVTEVTAVAWMGGVEIIVPPGLQVEVTGVGIMGAFEHSDEITGVHDPNLPILRIGGVAIWGGVEVTVRHQGESARDAKRRRKLERKERRRRLKGG
jgi:hypothetical protein